MYTAGLDKSWLKGLRVIGIEGFVYDGELPSSEEVHDMMVNALLSMDGGYADEDWIQGLVDFYKELLWKKSEPLGLWTETPEQIHKLYKLSWIARYYRQAPTEELYNQAECWSDALEEFESLPVSVVVAVGQAQGSKDRAFSEYVAKHAKEN